MNESTFGFILDLVKSRLRSPIIMQLQDFIFILFNKIAKSDRNISMFWPGGRYTTPIIVFLHLVLLDISTKILLNDFKNLN